MIDHIERRFLSLLLAIVMVVGMVPQTASAAMSGNGLSAVTGLGTTSTNATNSSFSANGTDGIIGTATSSEKCSGLSTTYSQNSVSLTLTNNLTKTAVLKFTYSLVNAGAVQFVAGNDTISLTEAVENREYSKALDPSGTVVVTLTSQAGTENETKLTISGVTLTESSEVTTTFVPASSGGSITVDGKKIAEETAIGKESSEYYTLTAVPDSGYKLLGWYNVTTGEYFSAENTIAELYLDSASTITAYFVEKDIPVFGVNKEKFTDLQTAIDYAVAGSHTQINLLSDGTISKEYTIPSGITLLIPFDSGNTCYKEAPENTAGAAWAKPTAYRTLTMADGAKLIVEGSISVSAKHATCQGSKDYGGMPTGNVGFIKMSSGSNITVKNAGTLYVWGYIIGNGSSRGTVVAESGATVYENMMVTDFRGGTATTGISSSKKVFPFSQYYVQNIEVPLELQSGAIENVCTSVYMNSTPYSSTIKFIAAQGGLFTPSGGTVVTKTYLPDEDRLELKADGDMKMNSLSINLTSSVGFNSEDYILPITNNLTIHLLSGITQITQDVMLQPGSEIIIDSGAVAHIMSGTSPQGGSGYNLYVFDADQWQKNYAMTKKYVVLPYAPGRTYNRTEADAIRDVRVDVNGTVIAEGYLYTTGTSGDNSTGGARIESSEGTGVIELRSGAGSTTTVPLLADNNSGLSGANYTTEPLTPAKLLNADGTYTETAGAAANTTYFWSDILDRWVTAPFEITFQNSADTAATGYATHVQTVEKEDLETGPYTLDLLKSMKNFDVPVYNDGYEYVFKQWRKDDTTTYADGADIGASDVADIYEATTLTAEWTRKIKAIFKNGDDEFKVVEDLREGDQVAKPETNPEQTGSTFKEWQDKDGKAVTFPMTMPNENVTLTAAFDQIDYSITYANTGDKSMPKVEGLHYGDEVPVPATPTLTGHTFKSWTVKGDTNNKVYDEEELKAYGMPAESLTYTANWEANTYTITLDADGGTGSPDSITQAYGTAISEPTAPTKQGYTFLGWYNGDTKVDFTNLTMPVVPEEGLTFKAKWGAGNSPYTVVTVMGLASGGNSEKSETKYAETDSTVTITPETKTGYTLDTTASKLSGTVTSDGKLELKVVYTLNQHTVYTNVDGKQTKEADFYYGQTVTRPDYVPTKNYHNFLGWALKADATYLDVIDFDNTTLTMQDADIILYAVWEATQLPYTVTTYVMNVDGTTYTESEQSAMADLNKEIVLTPDSKDGFTLNTAKSHLEETIDGTDDALTIYYDRNQYKLYTQVGEEAKAEVGTYYYEAPVTAPAALTKEGYTFSGWSGVPEKMPANDVTVTGSWIIKSYTVTWKNYDDTVLTTTTVNHFDTAVYPESEAKPTKPDSEGKSYSFVGWARGDSTTAETDFTITGETTFTAVFEDAALTYTVTWKNYNGDVLETDENVAHGSIPKYNGTTPTKKGNAQYTYTFKEWAPEVGEVTGDTVYTATFTETVNTYTVSFYDEGGTSLLYSEKFAYGTVPTFNDTEPTKAADNTNTYEFAGWDKEFTEVQANQSYTATYTATKINYTVTFKNAEGQTLQSSNTLGYGDSYTFTGTKPENYQDERYNYAFAGWDLVTNSDTNTGDGEVDIKEDGAVTVTGHATYVPAYTKTDRLYTVTWVVEGQENVVESTYKYNDTPAYPNGTPAKAATAQHTYTFDGWEPAITQVTTDNVTYTAKFRSTVNQYTIWFLDEDGKELYKQTVGYGTAVTYAGSTPAKASSESKVFAFAGWDTNKDGKADIAENASVEVKSDLIYTAVFSESAREYTIKFVGFNADGTEKVLDTQKVAYGTSVTYSCDTPTKASTESTEYTFSGWDTDSDGDADVTTEKVSVEVKSDLTYKAVFAESARKYTIKFVNWDNTLLENGEFVLEYGATPAYNGTPTRPEDNYNTYEFKGWDPAVTPVTGEKTYKATYTETAKSYTVKFLDADGNQVYSTSLGYMATSKYEEKPEKAQSAQYTYEFKGWDLVIENDKGDGEVDSEDGSFTVEGNATYVPLYNEITRSYTITWLDENGNTLTDGTQSLPFGAHEPHAALTKDKSAQYTYTFAGWNLLENNTYDDEIEIKADAARFEVTGDATYKAVFTSTVNKYTVTWIIDGEETKVEYEYGATPTHENPVKESTATTDYTFRNWNPEIAMVESDATYTAEFTGTAREYTVIWNVDDKKTTEQVANGVAIPQPADPVKEHYTFAGWTPAVPDAMPTEDVTFTATWTPVEYTIQWDTDGNGTAEENETQKLAYNTSHDAKTGRRETNSKYSYTFIGWDANSDKTVDVTPGAKITVKGDATYTALFSETPVEHTITINANGGTCTTTAIKQGYSTAVAEPAISREGYTFAGWYKDESKVEFPVTMPDYDMTLKAEWTAIEYTIAFNTDSGSEVENITQGYETEITSLPVTTRNGYTFQGWYDGENKVEASEENPLKMPLNGMTLTAKWKANTYKLIYHSNYGDPETIQEQEIKIGETISSMYSGFTREGYAFLGWSKDPAVTEPTYKADSGYSHGEAKNVDLYAVWQVRQYTITFDSDGGSPVAPIGAAYLSTINEPTEPTKTGHSFAGWDANGDKQADEFPETMPLNGGNMTALWTVNSYKVTFVDVDVEGNQTPWHDAGELAYNSKIDVAKLEGYTDPSRETTKYYEYKFEGWDSDDADNEADQELIVADRDMTFVAVYSQKGIEYTIYWDIDGDSTPDEIEKVPYGDRIVAPTAKEKPGYTAVGWSYAGGEIPKTMPARDLMFVAEYEINKYTITFDAGEGKFDNGESKYEVTGIYQSAVTAPVAPTRVGYRFTGWNVEVPSVMPAESMTVTANWELEDATFIFYNEDGRIYQSVVVDENVSQIEKPADPAVKDGYRFVAWVDKDNQEVAFPINGDALENGIAMYPKVEAIAYMITIDENGGDEVADITAAYESSVTLPDMTRAGYVFAGWENIEGNTVTVPLNGMTVKALWAAQAKDYVVETYIMGVDGTYPETADSSETKSSFTGENVSVSHAAMTGFTAGTDSTLSGTIPAEGTLTLKLYYVRNQYKFTTNVDGDKTETEYYYEAAVETPATPTKEGHTFASWSPEVPVTMPAEAVEVTAQWDVNEHTVTWMADGRKISQDSVQYGTEFNASVTPGKEGHTFVGWTDEDGKDVTFPVAMGDADRTFHAKFTANSYTVTWMADGSKVDEKTYEYGAAVTAPADPEKTGYKFVGWDVEVPATMPAENLTVNAVFTIKQYTVTLMDGDEEVETITADFGSEVTLPTLTKAGYEFAGWEGIEGNAIASLESDMTVRAQWTAKDQLYVVRSYVMGVDGKYPNAPTSTVAEFAPTGKKITAKFETMTGFTADQEASTVEGVVSAEKALILELYYSRNQYTLTTNVDNVETVDTYYFEAPVAAPAKPTKEGYTCTGWDGEIPATMPAENLEFTAQWQINSHTVTWKLGNGEDDVVVPYEYGKTIEMPETPEREGHSFGGWNPDYAGTKMPDNDLESTAKWTVKNYSIVWTVDKSTYNHNYDFGAMIQAPAAGYVTGHTFAGWAMADDPTNTVIELPETMPAKDLELRAVYEPNAHTITWIVDGEETVVNTTYGAAIEQPKPEKEGYTFDGWLDEAGKAPVATMPDSNLTYIAQWTVNAHTVTWMVDGKEVDKQTAEYGTAVKAPEEPEKTGYTFVEWDTTLDTMPDKDVTINGLFTINQYTITFETGEGSAVEAITQNYNTYIRKPANPTREGYTFNGWLKNGVAAEIPGNMPAESYTLTADWAVNSYKIVWNVDGTKTTDEVAYGTAIEQPATPVKEGYTFASWGAEVPATMPAQNLTFVAEWKINTHTVTWDVDGEKTTADYTYGKAISKPAAPTKTGYTFTGWDGEIPATMPAENLEFTAQWQINSHTVTWKQGNGEANVVQTYKYGETIAKPADPEKEGHRFDGWTPGVATTMPDEDLTYTAKWTANSYSLTWKVDGKTEMGRQVYGTAITKKADPVKEGYTFAGWAREDAPDTVITVPATMPAEDLVLVAVWTTNKHTVTWNVDGKLEKETYAFGETPVHADPEKEGWTFTGWTPKVTAMGDADVTYTAAWAINEYTITWNLNNGTEATQTKVTYGDVITAQTPVKEGYKFMGWTVAGAEAYETAPKKMPAEDLTYTANWAVSSYTVTWNVDGKLTKETYAYGDTINVPAEPEKAGYVFDSWAPAVPAVMPAENMTFTAVWENDQYTVTWIVDEAQTTVEYAYGDAIVKPADPVKEGWTFGGWKVTSGSTSYIPNTMPAENLEITAQWTQNKHTVTWDVDGKTTAKTYLYGETVTVPADPEKVGYTFSGWTPTVSQTMGDADVTYTATWTVKSHTITWNVDGRTTEDTYNYGDTIQARTANKAYHIFAGWMNADGAIVEVPATMPDENLIFTVKWDPYDYFITFHANNGTDEKAEQTVEHNVAEKLDANPFTYEGYGFKGWATDKDSTETPYKDTDTIRVTTDMSLYAVWEEGQYTITWNVDGTETTSSCKYGTNIVLPATPTKTGYTFAGWLDEDGNKVTASTKMPAMDLTLTASWNVNYYDVTWDTDGDGDVDDTISVAYGQMPVHADGSRPSGAQFDYTFTGWSPELAAVTGNAAYKAQFTAAVRAYTVTFVTNADGIPVNPVTAQYGDSITLRTLTREGYTFKGWSVNPVASEGAFGSYKITGETTLYAIWSANTYQISFVNEFGDTLTYKQYYGTPVELPEEPVQEGHTFNGWVNKKNPEAQIPETMPAEHLTFVADWTINQYTITFANTGDSKMDPITADYAAAIVIPADPKREGYTFTGWDIDIPETMPAKNLTITAKWERNVYTILWDVNGDGSVDPFEMEVAEQVEHGRWPLEQVGRKAPDAQYTYIFTGWTPEVKEATQDQVYVAQFTTSVNKYTIGWDFNGDGEAEDTTTVSYGAMPAYDAVKKKSDEKYTYTFTGWSPELTEVTGDTMYTAQFEATPVEYTVNFLLDQTGGIYQTVTAGYGTAIAVPENPEKTGYTFIGWDKEIPATMPVGGATLTGLWTINSYTITFDSDGGTEVASIKARFGGAVTAPAAPTRTGYTFAGWQPAVPATMPAENMTLKAQWTPNQYIITFGSNGGSQVEAITQAYGSAVTAPEAPVREGYTFAGWDQDVPATMPAENITLTAQWTPNSYDVRFYTDDSMTELHATVSADCDASFQLPEEPTRAGYNFGGWYWMDQEGNEVAVPTIMPAGGMDAYAKWDIDSFTISFNTDGGSVVESITAEYGAEIFAPADPEKEGYSFDGWDVEFPATMPAQSMTLNAVWKINQYTIRFNTDGGSEIASITQDYNTAVTAPAENPTKAGYTFLGWDAAIPTVMPAWDVTISAQWTPNQYTITFNTNGGSAIDTILADFGSALTEPAAPVKTGYVFAGWDVEFPATMPLDGLTLNAQWAAIDYAIYWDTDGDGEVDDTTNVAYDTMPEHADGAKPATAEFSYVFAGWDPEISLVRGTATYSALFSSVPNTYTITFDTVGGSELEPVTYAYGSAVAEPAAPTKEGYIFTGWDALPATMPAENIVVAAQWRVVDYSITFDSAGGTEVAPVTAGYLTTIAAPNDPTREGYTFTGWTPAFPEIMPLNGMKLTATWAINQYTITFNTNGGSEIAPITQDYGTAITAPAAPVKEGYTFTGWNAEIPATMPAANMTFTAQWEYTYSGWLTDEIGTTYLIDGEKAYYAQWANIDGNDYYFDSEGYIVKGLYQTWSMDDTYEATFVFDKETGVFLKDLTTVYADGEDLYYVENGEVINYPGLVRIVKDDGEINYYYFGADNKVVKDGTYTVTQNNGLLPVDPYIFGADGVIEHHEDTSRNGIHEENGKKYFYIDGVKVHMGLVEVDGEYYYAANGGELICGRTYWITRTNDLLPEKAYTFDEEGKIVFETEEPEEPEDPTDPTDPTDPSEPEEPVKPVKNGIYAEDGSLFYYENDERTYGGLLEINGYFYYAKINGEVIHGRSFWITKTNGLMEEGNYAFDNQGRMILAQEPEGPTDPSEPENPTEPEEPTEPLKNGIYAEDGSLYYYEDGVRTYAGLIEIDGYYYYVRTSGEVVHGRSYWITKTNGILPEKSYTFDDQGRMIDAAPSQKDPGKNGIYEEDGSLYYYEDGLRTYGGLMEIDGDYYYAKTDGEVVNSRKYWITKTNGLKPETSYNFDSKGRMIIQEEPVVPLKNGIYEEDGSLYYYEDGERTYAGLIVIDGYYYYIKTNCEAVHDCTYWITKTNDLLPAMNYTFDEQGRIQDVRPGDFDTTKNGIYKENGTLYYYVDGYKTNAGLIQIDGAYYYAKSDGAIVTGRKYYVAKTNGLMASGYYTFDAEGKMVQ